MAGRYKGSKLDNWGTPQHVFEFFNRTGNYDLDLAAEPHNAKCPDFCSLETWRDGLTENITDRSVWVNPPFGDIAPWIEKAISDTPKLMTLLLPARVGMAWFRYCLNYGFIEFLRGRLTFEPPPDYVGEVTSAPFDCMAVHFGWILDTRLAGEVRQITIPKPDRKKVA